MPNRAEPLSSHVPALLRLGGPFRAELVLPQTDTVLSDACRPPTPCSVAIAAELTVTIPPNFIW
jgi:hypothetical protein